MRTISVLAVLLPVTLALILLMVVTDFLGPVTSVLIIAPLVIFHMIMISAFGLVLRESGTGSEGLSSRIADLNQIKRNACSEDEHDLVVASDQPPESPQLRCSKCGYDSLTLLGLLGHDLDLPEKERQRLQGRLRTSQKLMVFAKDLFMVAGIGALVFAALSFFIVPTGTLTQQFLVSGGILLFIVLLIDWVVFPRIDLDEKIKVKERLEELRTRN